MRPRRGYRAVLEEALAAHEAFRKMDVAPDEIFFQVAIEGTIRCWCGFVIVKRHNGFEFNYVAGILEDAAEAQKTHDMWSKAVMEWNGDDPAMEKERKRIWEESNVANHTVEFAAAWGAKLMKWERRGRDA